MGKIFSDSLQVLYVTLYQLWYAQGYQEFAGIESSVTTKVNSIINCPLLKCIDWKTVSFCLLLRIIISKVGNKAMFVSGLYMIPQPGISCYHEPVQCGKLINIFFYKNLTAIQTQNIKAWKWEPCQPYWHFVKCHIICQKTLKCSLEKKKEIF